MAWYKTGTVAVTNASTTVAGTGTNFVSGAQVGDGFLGPNELLYEITAINSATSLTIAPAYGGATASGQSYAIAPTQGLVASLASDVTDLITDYQSVVDNAGAGKFGDGSAASPAIRFTNDQDTGFFRDTANEIAFATAGVKRGEFTSSGIQLLDGQKFIAGTGSDLQIYHSGTHSFIDDAGQGNLYVRGNSIQLGKYTGEIGLKIQADDAVTLYHDNSQVFTTTSSGATITGSLGIGTSSPSDELQLTGADPAIRLDDTSANGYARLEGLNGSLILQADEGSTVSNSIIRFDVDGSEAMRISDGNLLVGKTVTSVATAGHALMSSGQQRATVNGDITSIHNRLTSDGDIVQFRKAGTTVGTIGTIAGDLTIGDDDIGIRFDTGSGLVPWDLGATSTGGSARDAAIDIGAASARFKDLYLSGVARVEEARIGPSSLQTATITGLKANANKCITGDPEGGEFVAYRVDNAIAFGDFIGAYLFGNDDNTSTEDHFCGMWAKGAATSGSMDMFFAAGNTGYETDTPQMTLKASGFLGVGTNVPASNLHVQARTSTENCGLRVISGTSNVSYINLGDTADNNICSIEHDNSTNQLKIYTNNGVAMAIDISKRVSVNSTSSTTEGYVHRMYLNEQGTGATSAALGCRIGSTATRRQINFINPNGIVGRIQTSGTATAYVTSSDYRLKENVVDITDGIERVKQLSPKRFNFIADADLTVDGFIAHETQTVVPEAIDGVKDETHAVGNLIDAAGGIVETGIAEPEDLQEGHTWTATGSEPVYQGIDQSKIVPVLTAALKEAIAKIEALETRLTALEG
jgi:hypothetical protein